MDERIEALSAVDFGRPAGRFDGAAEDDAGDAILLVRKGRYEEAEPLLRRLLAELEATRGADADDCAEPAYLLAEVLVAQGGHEEAERLYRRALAIKQRVLGLDHPDVAANLHNLALVLDARGDREEAELLWSQARRALEAHTGRSEAVGR